MTDRELLEENNKMLKELLNQGKSTGNGDPEPPNKPPKRE